MASGMRQAMRQGQSLVMTQQLQQAIKLLQLSSQELTRYVDQQIETNPLLELDDRRDETRASPDLAVGGTRSLSTADRAMDSPLPGAQDGGPLDTAFDNVFSNDDRTLDGNGHNGGTTDDMSLSVNTWSTAGISSGGGYDGSFDGDGTMRLSETPGLRDLLHEQLALSVNDVGQQMIGRYLIDTLDDSGYLTDDPADIAGRLGCTLCDVETVITMMQTLEPPGVFARSLAECLALQLRDRNRLDPAMQTLIDNLDLLGDGKIQQLKKRCGVEDDDFADMLEELRALDPKPGLAFDTAQTEIVTPDVFVSQKPDGTWAIELNQDVLPRVLVNRQYYAEVKAVARGAEEKSYLSDCLSTGSWLVKALDQRARTIMKVTTELVRQQDGFFAHGVSALRPLTLHQVADAIGMHESTVSRVTANKYLSCIRGTFELKYFFTAAIAAADGGEAHSAEAVRHRIRSLIDGEDPKAILSDDKIVTLLKNEDIDIARRTVAKYREAMHIPSSVQRRRLKAG